VNGWRAFAAGRGERGKCSRFRQCAEARPATRVTSTLCRTSGTVARVRAAAAARGQTPAHAGRDRVGGCRAVAAVRVLLGERVCRSRKERVLLNAAVPRVLTGRVRGITGIPARFRRSTLVPVSNEASAARAIAATVAAGTSEPANRRQNRASARSGPPSRRSVIRSAAPGCPAPMKEPSQRCSGRGERTRSPVQPQSASPRGRACVGPPAASSAAAPRRRTIPPLLRQREKGPGPAAKPYPAVLVSVRLPYCVRLLFYPQSRCFSPQQAQAL